MQIAITQNKIEKNYIILKNINIKEDKKIALINTSANKSLLKNYIISESNNYIKKQLINFTDFFKNT
jgi:hypothetical protein